MAQQEMNHPFVYHPCNHCVFTPLVSNQVCLKLVGAFLLSYPSIFLVLPFVKIAQTTFNTVDHSIKIKRIQPSHILLLIAHRVSFYHLQCHAIVTFCILCISVIAEACDNDCEHLPDTFRDSVISSV
jgi:hypothetical protein